MMRRLLRANGTGLELEGPITMREVRELIGAQALDFVSLHHLGSPLHVMCVDDNGYQTEVVEGENVIELKCVKALKPLNAEATRLYHANCRPGTTHQIVGDVVIVPDDDFA